MQMKVTQSNVLYKRLPNDETYTKGGLILLPGGNQAAVSADGLVYGGGTQRYMNVLCEVIDVGPGAIMPDGTRQKMSTIKPGDIIVLDQQSGRSLGDESGLAYCHISEIIGIYKDE